MSSRSETSKVGKIAAQRADSTFSLDRSTEQEGIVVDEGYCDLTDPNFSDAAKRLEHLDVGDFDVSSRGGSRGGSSKSLGALTRSPLVEGRSSRRSFDSYRGNSSRSLKGSTSQASGSNSLKSTSGKSLKGTASQASASSTTRLEVPQPSAKSGAEASAAPEEPSEEVPPLLSAQSNGGLPPGSPFSHLDFQASKFPSISAEGADAKLKALGLNERLLSGLQSLSCDELAVFMQLSDELKKEGIGASSSGSSTQDSSKDSGDPGQQKSSEEEAAMLELAVRKLKTLLPPSAIQQLQSHASYGLVDVINSQPFTPPPTPTSPAAAASEQ